MSAREGWGYGAFVVRTYARSSHAASALALVETLQRRFFSALERVAAAAGSPVAFERVEWLRDEGRHGGGTRYKIGDSAVFDRGSVNVSQVHYDDRPDKKLGSATALSTIIHPRNPHAPSVHLHVSWTEMRGGTGYWRIMADLNPAIADEPTTLAFAQMLRDAAPEHHVRAMEQGDRYFHIPALSRHRGVCHFYLEGHQTGEHEADEALARSVIQAAIDHYVEILARAIEDHPELTAEDRAAQLEYHTLYLFQVLTLDRGTTSGLLVHGDNDLGILGSLPSHVDRERLASWRERMSPPQDELLDALVAALPPSSPSAVTDEAKRALVQAVRGHYRAHPEALDMQARGDIVPPTVDNHR